MLAFQAPTPGQTTKRASFEISGRRRDGVSRWKTRIAIVAQASWLT